MKWFSLRRWSIFSVSSFIVIAGVATLSAQQKFVGEIEQRKVLSSNDTLLSRRGYGDFWFGAFGGVNLNSHIGNYIIPKNDEVPVGWPDRLVDLGSGVGWGTFVGLTAEWAPPLQFFGAKLDVFLSDTRSGVFEPNKKNNNGKTYNGTAVLNYISVMPSVRMTLFDGFHLLAGLDFDVRNSSEAIFNNQLDSISTNIDTRKVAVDTRNFRFGVHVGAGYDLLAGEVARSFRVRFSPFITLHAGTPVNDQWNIIYARAGISLKFGKNRQADTILKMNPNAPIPRPQAVLAFNKKVEFEYKRAGFQSERLSGVELALVLPPEPEPIAIAENTEPKVEPKPEKQPENPPETKVEVAQTQPADTLQIDEGEKKVIADAEVRDVITRVQQNTQNIDFNKVNVSTSPNTYRSSTSTALDKETTERLDAYVEFLQKNPRARLQIVGHTDNFGTPGENQRISVLRAEEIKKYFVKKGISDRRLLVSGSGSLRQIAEGRTEESRRKNRRVEITVIR